MIRPKPMNKVTVFGPKIFMKQVIEKLYDLNFVHIEDHSKNETFDIGTPLETNESYAEHIVKLRSLISTLKIPHSLKNISNKNNLSIEEIKTKSDKLYEDFSEIQRKKEYYLLLKKTYQKKKLIEKLLQNIKIEFDKNHEDYLYYIGFINKSPEILKQDLEKTIKKYFFFSQTQESLNLIALFVDKSKKEKTEELLKNFEFSQIENPYIKKQYPKLKSKSGYKFVKLGYQLENIEKKIKEIEDEILNFKKNNSSFLISAENKLKIESEKAEAPLKFGATKNTFLIKGYVPVENKEKLEKELNNVTDNKIMIKFEEPKAFDNVPTAFNHPKIVEPFEAFMDLYTIPKYKEIDPTFFMFLTFPIFFGFMLGDVGYGLITLTLFLLLKAKMPTAKNLLNAFIIASIASIFFGIIFGEYFGFEYLTKEQSDSLRSILPKSFVKTWHMEPRIDEHKGITLYPIPHLFSRSHGIVDLLSMAVLFGIVHILIAFIIGFFNVYSAHGLKHAIFEKLGWILIMPLIVWLLMEPLGIIKGFVYDILKVIIPPLPILIAMFLIGAIFTIIGEGVQGAIEVLFMSLMSNILSYGRLMAVGLASLSLAVVVNEMATNMFKSGIFGILIGIFVLLIGHTINIALGILSPFLHSLRLHYVEFFNKFFKGGGKKFKPFGHSN